MKPYLFSICFLLFATILSAQSPTQTVRGTVSDLGNNQPLVGVTIGLVNQNIATVSDEDGIFRLEQVPVGRQQIQISYIGRETIILPVLVESGKEVLLDITLRESQSGLDTVVVKSPRLGAVQPLSSQTITIEETFRYPATFYDPARMMTLYPGVANVNNQGNALSVRGNSPNFNQWRLEGVEIVNPNHTPNAGTFSDRITQSAGGVNILSAQLLDYSTFLTSAYPVQYNNALGGILDMKLRKGNDEQHEFVGQIGLIGLDVAAEGPLSKNSKASYLANYRYSTIGLLSDLGVDVGDEDISFQDFSMNLSFPTDKAGDFTLFGVWGASDNVFITDRDTTLWEENKDRFDIIFDSRTVIVGGTHRINLGESGIWKTSLAFSELESGRTANRIAAPPISGYSLDQQNISKLSLHSYYSNQINNRHTLTVGFTTTRHAFDINVERTFNSSSIDLDGILWQPYVNWNGKLSDRFEVNAGLSYSYFSLSESTSLEPRLSLNYQLNNQQRLSFLYGLHSQTQIPELYRPNACSIGTFCDQTLLGFNKAHHLALGYQYQLTPTSNVEVEVYYQSLFDIPISNHSFTQSAINFLEADGFYDLQNGGTGQNYGVELAFQKLLLDDYYLLANASFFESKYTARDGIERDTRWNGNYIFNATGGKEWKWQKKERQMILGANVNVSYLGGFREQLIDTGLSKIFGQTIFNDESAFILNQTDYFKTDFRIYYKRNKAKYNTTLALDIQNLTNQKNVAYQYYDVVQEQVLTKFQLGLIPILTWRIEF